MTYRVPVWMRAVQVVVAVVVALAAVAHANPAAEKVYQDGKALLAAGKTAEACEAFRRSQELEARVGTLLNLGECEEQRGRIATAWVAFIDARALATRLNDARATYADQRAAALAPKLSYLTMKIADGRPEGFIVRRNGLDVASAELGLEVPLDPGHYEIDASAPGSLTWKHSIDLTLGQHAAIEIPALAVDPSAPTPKPTIIGALPPRTITSHRVGIGAAIGFSSDGDVIFGVRVPLHLAPLGPGTIRAVPSLFYAKLEFPDPYQHAKLYAVGFGVEYVAPLAPMFVVAAGLGIGVDFLNDNYNGNSQNGWGAARLSPTLRLAHSVDVAVHLQVVGTKNAIVGLGEVGVDYFFW